jgi:predicted nucleic acid-binding protein
MSLPIAYVDTSAFIKRFIEEPGTNAIEHFIAEGGFTLAISSLSMVEIKSVLKRKILQNEISADTAKSIKDLINLEIASQSLFFQTIDAGTFERTGHLIEALASQLGALDAIHLACAKTAKCTMMVSADKQLLRASLETGLDIFDLNKQ